MKKLLILYFLLAFATVSKGQTGEIIHTICGPEYSFTVNYQHPEEGLVYLDYDQDRVNDHYIFSEHVYSWAECQIRIQGVDGTPWRLNANPCSVGDTISSYPDSWYYWPWSVLLRGWKYNYNNGASNDYANTYYSVRKPTAKGYLYAWWRISITWRNSSDVTLTIHEMAYCTEPGYPLRVGQTSFDWTAVDQTDMHKPTIYPNPTEGVFTVSGEDIKEVEVFNALGQHILTKLVDGSTAYIDLESQPAGIYFVNVTEKNGKRCVKKIVKE